MAGKGGSSPPDVLLVTIDTLRADALGFMGNAKAATPTLDRLARAGKVFPFAHAHNVITLPSHTNILTGLYPFQHGVRENSGFRLAPDVPTLASLLRAAGYRTAAFVAAYPLSAEFGLGQGFETYDDRFPRGSRPTEFVLAERRGDQVVAPAREWWQAHRGERRFLWVHLFDPHAPYAPPEPFASRFKNDPYLGEVAATDSFLTPLLEPFLAGREAPALVIVTGDHGEALGEHGELTHGLFAYEPTLHVPLVVWGAGVSPGSDPRSARHVDILPTVLAATGVKMPAARFGPYPGRSLLAAAPSGSAADAYFESLSAALNRGWAPLSGLIRDGKKAISLPLAELYDLARDAGETTNLYSAEKALAERMLAAVPRASIWPPRNREQASSEATRRLEALGYVASTAPIKASYGAEDDPKALIQLDGKIHNLIDLYSRGQAAAAVKLGREIVNERPGMPIGHSLLAQALLEAGDTPGAVTVMEGARAKGLASDSLLRQLALSLAELGRAAEGLAVIDPLARQGDREAQAARGLLLSEAGRQDEARRALQDLLAKDADNPKAFETLALVALRQGRWAEARDQAEKALALNADLPLAWNNLGVARFQLGEASQALAAWQRAVELDPKLYDALYNLGFKALQLGRADLARPALERFVATAPPARFGPDIAEARQALSGMTKDGR